MNTWTSASASGPPLQSTPIEKTRKGRWSLKSLSKNKSIESHSAESGKDVERHVVYWPFHFLHKDCPHSRILTWGYESAVSNFFQGSANKNNVFAHSRDLLADLKGKRITCVSTGETWAQCLVLYRSPPF